MARLIDDEALYRKIKTECNPYGAPTIDFESGKRVLDIIDNADPVNPAESVFNELCKCGLFTGKYDAKNGNRQFMNGIWTVMETIAAIVSEDCRDRFNTEFAKNLGESEIRAYMEGKDDVSI